MIYTKQEFERLYKDSYRMMYRLAFSLLEDGEEARDAVGQVFTQMWHKKPKVDEASMRGYLLAAVRNQCLSALRQRRLREKMENELRGMQEEQESQERTELMAELQRVIEENLTEQDRRILSLHYDEDMTYSETAEELGISVSAVNKHITRSLFKIRQKLRIVK